METRAKWRPGWRRDLRVAMVLTAGALALPYFSPSAWGAVPVDPLQGLRETTKQYVALGTPDDLLRLLDASDKTEQEIARLKLGAFHPQKQDQIRSLKERLAESEALLRLLDRSTKEVANRELDPASTQGRASLRATLMGRIGPFKESITMIEKEIRAEQTAYLRSLEQERKALAKLLVMRREQLLGEYAGLSGCAANDRACLHRKLKTLCRLQPLFPEAERLSVLTLIQEVDSQLGASRQTATAMCDYFRYDFGL